MFKRGFKLFLVMLFTIITFSNLAVSVNASTDYGSSFITGATLYKGNGEELQSNNVNHYDVYRIEYSFDLKDNVVKSGDTMRVSIPDVFVIHSFNDFELKDGDLSTGRASVDTINKEVVVTFSDGVENMINVNGGFYLEVKFHNDLFKDLNPIEYTIEFDNDVHAYSYTPIPITIGGIVYPYDIFKDFIRKSSVVVPPSEQCPIPKISWTILLNEDVKDDPISGEVNGITYPKEVKNIVLEDVMSENQELYDGPVWEYSFNIELRSFKLSHEGGVVIDLENTKWFPDVLSNQTKLNESGLYLEYTNNSFVLRADDISGKMVLINYHSKMLVDETTGMYHTDFNNKVVGTYNENQEFNYSKEHLIVDSEGYGNAIPGSVRLIKTDVDTKEVLQGVKFELYSHDTDELIYDDLITDDKGEILVTGLNLGSYYFKETKAKEGYVLSDKIIEFEIIDRNSPILNLAATNKKVEIAVNSAINIDETIIENKEIEMSSDILEVNKEEEHFIIGYALEDIENVVNEFSISSSLNNYSIEDIKEELVIDSDIIDDVNFENKETLILSDIINNSVNEDEIIIDSDIIEENSVDNEVILNHSNDIKEEYIIESKANQNLNTQPFIYTVPNTASNKGILSNMIVMFISVFAILVLNRKR